MADNVGTLYLKIEVDDTGVQSGLDKAKSTASDSGGFLKNALSFATGGALLEGLKQVGSGILGVAKGMIDGNAEFEKYQTQFGVLLGSTDEAKKRLDELAKFGASTPFELPELVRADKVLTSFGIHSEDMLTIVGDVAAGTGSSFEDMALLMGKFSSGATGEAISRFQEMGIATKDELAKMGIAFDKGGSMTTPVAEAMPILEALMKDKFGGMMDAQSKTFDGMKSNLEDWVGSTLRTLGAPIFDVVKDKLALLLAFLSSPETMATLNNIATTLATVIGNAMDYLSNDVIPALITAWNTIQPAVAFVIAVFDTLNASTTNVGGNWNGLTTIINSAANLINTVVTAIFSGIQTFLQAHGTEINAFLSETWKSISTIIDTFVKLINATIVPMFTAIAAFIRAHSTEIQTVLSGAWSIIQGIVKVALSIIQGVVATVLALIQGNWSGAWNAMSTMVSGVFDGIKLIISGALSIIQGYLSMAWDAIKGVASTAWNFIKDNIILAVWESIKTGVNTKIGEFKTAISGGWDAIKTTAATAWNYLKDTIVLGTWDSMKSSIDGKITTFTSAVNGVWSDIKEKAAAAWSGIATSIETSFSGITGKIKSAINSVIDVVNDAIDAINSIPGVPNMDKIKKLANGTNFWQGGTALVGEVGPELVNLPRGSQVIPNNQTMKMLGNSGAKTEYHLHLTSANPDNVLQQFGLMEASLSKAY